MKCKSYFVAFYTAIAFSVIPALLWAQPGGGGPDPDPQVPLDGGVSLLVAAGVGYAIKKAHDKRKQEKAIFKKEK